MERNPRQVAALRAIGIHRVDAEAIIEIAARLQRCNEDAWPDAANFWHVVSDEDGKRSFWLSEDGTEATAFPRHVCELEKRQITSLRWILRRYPGLCACMQPDPSSAAITITRADQDLDELQGGFIVISPAPAADDRDR
jgi:hypothetical protein